MRETRVSYHLYGLTHFERSSKRKIVCLHTSASRPSSAVSMWFLGPETSEPGLASVESQELKPSVSVSSLRSSQSIPSGCPILPRKSGLSNLTSLTRDGGPDDACVRRKLIKNLEMMTVCNLECVCVQLIARGIGTRRRTPGQDPSLQRKRRSRAVKSVIR